MQLINLLYHDLITDSGVDGSGFPGKDSAIYKMPEKKFELHMQAIHETFSMIPHTLHQILDARCDQSGFCLTFDDGGISTLAIADILEQHGWRGNFFITTDYIGKPTFLSTEHIQDLHKRGHLIGSHSCSHPAQMSHLPWAEMKKEWYDSKQRLSDCVGSEVITASIPGGYYSKKVASAAAAAGIQLLCTSEPSIKQHIIDECWILGRYTLQQQMDTKYVLNLLNDRSSKRLQQYCYWNLKKIAKMSMGSSYVKLRKLLFNRFYTYSE